MGQLYLEFDEKELKKNLELFERIKNEKNGDLEEAFKLFADKYINGEMDLAVFLQVVNKLYHDIHHIDDISLYQQLLEGIEKVKKYVEEKNCKIGIINIYEILIDIYNSMYEFNNVYELSKELLSIDEGNKIALLNLSEYEGEGENKKLILNYSIDDLAILNNLANYYSKNNEIDRAIEYNKIIISLTKDGNYLKEILPYNYMWGYYYISNTQNYLPIAQYNLGICYDTKYKKDKDIENRRKAENLYKESIKNYIEFSIKYGIPQPYIKDPIINLSNLYNEEEKYEEAHKLINEYSNSNLLPKDSDYYMLIGTCIYKENPCEKTAKKSLEYLKNSIRELNFIDSSSFEAAIQGALLYTIPLMYEMQEKKHIHYDAAKESLNQLYVYNAEKPNFNLPALQVSFDIKDYELCSKIALNIINNINNYPLDKEEYKMVLENLIISLHRLNKDYSKNLLNIFNDKDFNNYEYIVKLINECAEFEVLDNSIEIKNKKVLISLYEIMSFSRKELIVIRLFDYIRNADAYANMKINNDTEELETDRIARWKGDNVEIKNEYILCYHFHSSSEIQYKKDEYGNFQLNEKGEKIPIRISVRGERRKTIWRKFPAENWIAVNQIRDTLAHRINENDTDVNEAIRTTKNAREFIEANFTSIIECLFNVIKENNLLSDERFDSEDF